MPRKARETYRPWRPGGIPLGHVRSGVYWIDRTVHGRRYRISTGCRTPEAALGEYKKFEADPPRYVPRGKVGTGWDEAVKAFLRYSESVKLNSKRHVDHQEAHLANLGAFTRGGSRVFASLESFTAPDVRAFLESLTRGDVTGNQVGAPSVNRHLATLKAFLSWAREERLTGSRVDEEVRMVREDRGVRLPEEISPKRWRAVLARLDARWRAACEVMLGAGLRYGEVARLAPAAVLARGIHVPRAKSRRDRTVPCSARTVQAAKRLIRLGGVPDDEASQIDHRLRAAAKRARVAPFSSHALRHTYACVTLRALLKAGQSTRELQERLGHASIRTTERYLHVVRAGGGMRVVVGGAL